MPDEKNQKIAEQAKMIVDGYAFIKKENGMISILNLDHPDCAMVITCEGDLVETNMDEIEQHIVQNIYSRNKQFMEV